MMKLSLFIQFECLFFEGFKGQIFFSFFSIILNVVFFGLFNWNSNKTSFIPYVWIRIENQNAKFHPLPSSWWWWWWWRKKNYYRASILHHQSHQCRMNSSGSSQQLWNACPIPLKCSLANNHHSTIIRRALVHLSTIFLPVVFIYTGSM